MHPAKRSIVNTVTGINTSDRLSQSKQQNPEILKETKEKLEKIYSAYQTICKYNNKKSAERAQPI